MNAYGLRIPESVRALSIGLLDAMKTRKFPYISSMKALATEAGILILYWQGLTVEVSIFEEDDDNEFVYVVVTRWVRERHSAQRFHEDWELAPLSKFEPFPPEQLNGVLRFISQGLTHLNPKQEYDEKPLTKHDVQGASSKTIFKFMTAKESNRSDHPHDVDDFERNRALLLCYPEWRQRLPEMHTLGPKWANLVRNWVTIEQLYDEDYALYGNKAYGKGKCDAYIRSLVQ